MQLGRGIRRSIALNRKLRHRPASETAVQLCSQTSSTQIAIGRVVGRVPGSPLAAMEAPDGAWWWRVSERPGVRFLDVARLEAPIQARISSADRAAD